MNNHFLVLLLLLVPVFSQPCNPAERTYDGTCNNLAKPLLGSNFLPLSTADGVSFLDGKSIRVSSPNERFISNIFLAEDANPIISANRTARERRFGQNPDPFKRNSLWVYFGQMITHEISHIMTFLNTSNVAQITLPPGDPLQINPQVRGLFVVTSNGTFVDGVFKGVTDVSPWFDGQAVYGPNVNIANRLRTFSGGKMILLPNNELPFHNTTRTPNECGGFNHPGSGVGDFRSDSVAPLTALHAILVREHNRMCDEFALRNPSWTDEQLYQEARKFMIAYLQNIAYNEWMPAAFGKDETRRLIGPYKGYKPNVDPIIFNTWATAAGRVPHDSVNLPVLALNSQCELIKMPGTVGFPLQERPNCQGNLVRSVGSEAFIRGMLIQHASKFDSKVVDEMRSFFGENPFRTHFDIEAVNIFRSRVHGTPNYRDVVKYWTGIDLYTRRGCVEGATQDPINCFRLITRNETRAQLLQSIFGKINQVDAFVGLMAESVTTSTGFPYTSFVIWARQYKNIRDGDRWWFENRDNRLFTRDQIRDIKRTTIADIIRRNTNLGNIPDKAFYVPHRDHDDDWDDKKRHQNGGHHNDDDDDDNEGGSAWANLCI